MQQQQKRWNSSNFNYIQLPWGLAWAGCLSQQGSLLTRRIFQQAGPISDGHGNANPCGIAGTGVTGMGTDEKKITCDVPVPVLVGDGSVTRSVRTLMHLLDTLHHLSTTSQTTSSVDDNHHHHLSTSTSTPHMSTTTMMTIATTPRVNENASTTTTTRQPRRRRYQPQHHDGCR